MIVDDNIGDNSLIRNDTKVLPLKQDNNDYNDDVDYLE